MRKEFIGSRDSSTVMIIQQDQICLICDSDEKESGLGTGFLFLRNDWILTAAHVVMNDGLPRQNLYAEFGFSEKHKMFLKIKVLAVHKECDIAFLSIIEENNPCKRPFYPGNEELSTSKGIIYCGWEPEKKAMKISLVESFHRDARYREHEEVILEFPSQTIKGGYSGGPIFGDGGSVIGVIINQFSKEEEPSKNFGRAISINTVLDCLTIDLNDRMDIINY